jgi:hypothetical protein
MKPSELIPGADYLYRGGRGDPDVRVTLVGNRRDESGTIYLFVVADAQNVTSAIFQAALQGTQPGSRARGLIGVRSQGVSGHIFPLEEAAS